MKPENKKQPKTKEELNALESRTENTTSHPVELTSSALSAVCGGSIERQHTPQQTDEQIVGKKDDKGSGKPDSPESIIT